jgi:Gram-negative bacterial TonB protein C-terminal
MILVLHNKMMHRHTEILTSAIALLLGTWAAGCAARSNSLRDLPSHAVERSQTTLPGGHPFHLQAKVFEVTNRDNDNYDADIQEDWIAPDKWRRTIKTAKFSETLTTNGGEVSDRVTGDYYPVWLHTLVDAIFDPGTQLKGVDLTKSRDNPILGGQQTCRRFGYRVGIAPVQNTVFASYCFQDGLIQSIGKPGYGAEYSNYEKFGAKQVARKIQEWIEPGTILEADIVALNDLVATDAPSFAISSPSSQLSRVVDDEATLRKLAVNSPPIVWPTIRDGKPVGTLSIYVCIDRQGHVRETYGLNSDNPYMTDAARKQLMNWTFKPAQNNGEAVQLEGILTFAYQTQIVQ